MLGDGQQIAVAGNHPDTGTPYTWRGGRSPVNTPRALAPLVDEVRREKFSRVASTRWWTSLVGPTIGEVVPLVPRTDTLPPSLDERFAATEYQGAHGLNDAILAMTADRISIDGTPVKDVIEECLQFVQGVWDKIPTTTPTRPGGIGMHSAIRSRKPATALSKRNVATSRALSIRFPTGC